MSEPIKIGNQTFVKTDDGWIDKKTKAKAPEGLVALLDGLNLENTPVEKKKRVRFDTSRKPVVLGNVEYAWDLNSETWLTKKTKDPAPANLSAMIERVYQSTIEDDAVANILGTTPEEMAANKFNDEQFKKRRARAKEIASEEVEKAFGVVSVAAKQKSKNSKKSPTGEGQFKRGDIRINSPIVVMIEKLASIDSLLKQQLSNQQLMSSRQLVAQKEQNIEGPEIDAQPVIDEDKIDAEVEAENKKANAAMIAFGIGAVGLIAAQFDPVKEAFSGVVDFAKDMYGYLKSFVGITNNALTGMINLGNMIPGIEDTTPATPGGTPSGTSSASTSTQESGAASSATSMQANQSSPGASTTNMAAPTAMGSTASSSSPQATAVSSADEIVVTAPRRQSSSGSTRSSSGGASTTPSQDATRTSASPPTTSTPTPAAPSSSELSEAQNGTVWTAKDASGLRTFVRKINNKYETWTSEDSTHYEIDEGQALAQISSRGLKNVNTSDATATTDQTDGYISPIEGGGNVTSGYGMRTHPVSGGRKFHTGVDYGAPEGTPVRAVKSGTVTKAGFGASGSGYGGFGNVVIIDHGDGYQSVYAHLSRFACRVGETVRQGQVIGFVGNTGISTGSHLHFMIQKTGHAQPTQGNTIDPASLKFVDGTTIPASMEGYSMEGEDGAEQSALGKAAGAGWEITKGAIEAVANIIRAGTGEMSATTGSQLKDFDSNMAGSISESARRRNAEIAASRSEQEAMAAVDPINLNSSSSTSTIQNIPSASDYAGIDFYLTRMGFPKIEYSPLPTGRMA